MKKVWRKFEEVKFEYEYDTASFLSLYAGIFSLVGLASITGINKGQLSHYVTGRRKPSRSTAEKNTEFHQGFRKGIGTCLYCLINTLPIQSEVPLGPVRIIVQILSAYPPVSDRREDFFAGLHGKSISVFPATLCFAVGRYLVEVEYRMHRIAVRIRGCSS